MRVIYKNLKNGELKITAENLDDLWYLSQLIEEGDVVSGKSLRKVKMGGEDERGVSVKKPVFVELKVDKVELADGSLRVLGIVREGSSDVPSGSHHTLEISPGTSVSVKKEAWLKFQLDRLKEASEGVSEKVLICVLERDNASFALLKRSGYEMLTSIEGEVEKKDESIKLKGEGFFSDVVDQLSGYAVRYEIQQVILASPAFWKDNLMKIIKKKYPDLARKVTLATCSDTGSCGIDEVLKRDEVKTVLQKDRTAREVKVVEELLGEISKEGLAAYGFNDVKQAVEAKAVAKILVTDDLIQKFRSEKTFQKLDYLLRSVDNSGGDVFIVSVSNDGGKKLKGLGGIGAILRYKLKY